MLQTPLVALCALLIVLYLQSRVAAREIRHNREAAGDPSARLLMLRDIR